MKKTLTLLFLSMSFAALAQNADTIDSNSDEGEIAGHAYVDLGLPSGTLWAKCSIGADSPYLPGQFFAWGETTPRENFYLTNYEFYEETTENGNPEGILKSIGEDISGTEYDVAHCLWGNGWRMPACQDFEELISFCQTEFKTNYQMVGLSVKGPNGNTIWLPITLNPGDGYTPAIIYGTYWSGTLADDTDGCDALALHFSNSEPSVSQLPRYEGCNIRPVIHPQDIPSGVATIADHNAALTYRDGTVFIDGYSKGGIINVADLSGRNLYSLSFDTDRCKLPHLEPGIYVVTFNRNANPGSSLKITVR